jgi:predicted enzyme related to lactoylglutathione lyase
MTASWSIYFGVADVDATLSKVADLGGSTVMPAEDTPYGRLATCTDSTDAIFKLRSTPS